MSREVWEGWTVQDFIDELEPIFNMVQAGIAVGPVITNSAELKEWLKDNQPYYKRHIPEVHAYFLSKLN